VNSSLLVIRSLQAFVPKYLFYFLSGPKLQNIAKEKISGSATPHLFQKDIKQFVLSVPPLLEQQEIVRRVEAMFKLADAVEKRVETARVRAHKLTQAILAKAFRGELVPTEAELARRECRPYESASELLARIKSALESKGVIERRRHNKTYKGDS
jgi:type I restriction enzyme S subunit